MATQTEKKTQSLKEELQKFVKESGRDDIEITLSKAVLHIIDHMDGTVDSDGEEDEDAPVEAEPVEPPATIAETADANVAKELVTSGAAEVVIADEPQELKTEPAK